MIHKGYVCEIAFEPEFSLWLDAWVWAQDKSPIPVSADGNRIGFISPERWWRHTIRKNGTALREVARICFTVRHDRAPIRRMGDFCGNSHSIRFVVVGGAPVEAVIERC